MLMDEFYAHNRAAMNDSDFDLAQVFNLAEDHVNNASYGNPPQETFDKVIRIFNGFLDNPAKYEMNPDHINKVKGVMRDFITKHNIEGLDLEARWES
jgi:hypothetical protein